jgi:hypothetical protein
MAVVAAMTLWGLGTAFFLFPLVNLPGFLHASAATLLVIEFVALLVHSYGSEGCEPARCSLLTRTAGALTSEDVPFLALVLLALAVGHGVTTRSR